MSKAFKPSIISANDLFEGDVVYLAEDGSWTRSLSEAAVAETADAGDALLKLANQPAKVVGPYLLAVAQNGSDQFVPVHFRERYRELGPSVRLDLGRQADGLAQIGPVDPQPVREAAE